MHHRTPLSIETRKVLRLLSITLLFLLLASSAYYFVKTTNTAEMGFRLRENQIKQKELEDQNRLLKQNVLEAQSIIKLQKDKTVSDMQEPVPIFVEPIGPLGKRN